MDVCVKHQETTVHSINFVLTTIHNQKTTSCKTLNKIVIAK